MTMRRVMVMVMVVVRRGHRARTVKVPAWHGIDPEPWAGTRAELVTRRIQV